MQQEAKNFSGSDVICKADRVQKEFGRLLERYPSQLSAEDRPRYLADVRLLMTMGRYRSEDGMDEVEVKEIGLSERSDRPVDVYVAFEVVRGYITAGRLPIVFFLEMHKFVRLDYASH